MEPHAPYAPSAESFRRFDRGFTGSCDGSKEALKAAPRIHPQLSSEDIAHLIDLYDAEIFDGDRGFVEFLGLLREFGRFEHALIILVADHGEAFAEHDTLEHGCTLNEEELHVPLIIRWPHGQFAGVRVKEQVSLADVFPTVLNAVGVRPRLGYGIPGRDLVDAAIGSSSTSERRIYAEVSRDKDDRLDLVGVIDEDGYKSAVDMSAVPGKVATGKSVGLWDTKKDPRETIDLRESLPVRASYDEQLIARWLVEQRRWCDASTQEADSEVEFTEEMREDLESLGYLD